jgi:hypothetical protein
MKRVLVGLLNISVFISVSASTDECTEFNANQVQQAKQTAVQSLVQIRAWGLVTVMECS